MEPFALWPQLARGAAQRRECCPRIERSLDTRVFELVSRKSRILIGRLPRSRSQRRGWSSGPFASNRREGPTTNAVETAGESSWGGVGLVSWCCRNMRPKWGPSGASESLRILECPTELEAMWSRANSTDSSDGAGNVRWPGHPGPVDRPVRLGLRIVQKELWSLLSRDACPRVASIPMITLSAEPAEIGRRGNGRG